MLMMKSNRILVGTVFDLYFQEFPVGILLTTASRNKSHYIARISCMFSLVHCTLVEMAEVA